MHLNKAVLVVLLAGGALIGLASANPVPEPQFSIAEFIFGPAPTSAPHRAINVNVAPQNNARWYQYAAQPYQYPVMLQPPTPPPMPRQNGPTATNNPEHKMPGQGQRTGNFEKVTSH